MPGPRLNAAFYAAPVSEFLAASDEEAYAPLASPRGYTLAPEQQSAWRLQLPVLRAALEDQVAPPPAAPIFPSLCATEACDSDRRWKPPHADGVRPSHTHDITRSDAGAVNLAATSGCIERIITAAKAGRRKAIVFVTGVPGAGKTLVGLNVATRHGERSVTLFEKFEVPRFASHRSHHSATMAITCS